MDSVADFGLLMALAWSFLITLTSARLGSRIKVFFICYYLPLSQNRVANELAVDSPRKNRVPHI
jgi:hypothetical protein